LYNNKKIQGGGERMLSMTSIDEIRRMYFDLGMKISEIERKSEHDRKTIRKYISETDFSSGDQKQKSNETKVSKLDPYKEAIDNWLIEDKRYRKKQRHTAKRVFDRLGDEFEGFDCSYRLVAEYVKIKKKEIYSNKNIFLPLEHPPGEAQVDFGQAQFYENGTLINGHYLVMTFPYSNAGFMQMFKGEAIECFLQGMKNIFNHIGGVPYKIWFDNASALVNFLSKKKERKVTDRFLKFSNHYNFQAVFCNPNSGHEKGNVENKVGFNRRNLLVPVPKIDNLITYNEELFPECEKYLEEEHYRKEKKVGELFDEDKKKLLPLNPVDFEIETLKQIKTDSYAKVRLNNGAHVYSTSPQFAESKVWVCLGAYRVRILDENYREVITHERFFGDKKQESMNWIPYLTTVSKRPGALKYTDIYTMFPDTLKKFVDKAEKKEQGVMLKQLSVLSKKGEFNQVLQALEMAIEHGSYDPDSVEAIFNRLNSNLPDIDPVALPNHIPVLPKLDQNNFKYDKALTKDSNHG